MHIVFWILGIMNLANGLWMMFAPESWYHGLPAGIPDTGPFNAHFVRDIGAAFTTIGLAFCFSAPRPSYRHAALLGATGFYGLHALIHVGDLLTGHLHADHWLIDLPGVFAPTLVLVALCLPYWWRSER